MLRSLALGALAVMTLCAAPAAADEAAPRRIVVNGTGEASARPDVAVIAAGVVVQADTASAALADNTRAMNAVLEQLSAAGLAAEDVQTSQFSVTPLYEQRRPDPDTVEPPRIVGYQVSNQVTAQVRDLDRLGAILDALVRAGANSINGPWFEIADPKQLQGAARDAAVADAVARAERYAAAAGVRLGEIISIEEGGSYAPPRPMMRAEAMAADVPIAPGQTEVSASVTMVFAIE
ncbi:MAG: SIMPL domain-containing protein [Geminicoccaceae bacterium]